MDIQVFSDWACAGLGAAGLIALIVAALRGHFKDEQPAWRSPAIDTNAKLKSGALSRGQKLVIGAIFFLVGLTGVGSVVTVWVAMAHR